MMTTVLPQILALSSAVFFGLQAFVVKQGLERGSPYAATGVSLVSSVLIFWALLLLDGIPTGVSFSSLLPFVVAGLVYPTAFRLLYFAGIDRIGASTASAIVAIYPALTTAFAVVLLSDTLTAFVGAGVAFIVVGGATLQSARTDGEPVGEGVDVVLKEVRTTSFRDIAYPMGAVLVIAVSITLIDVGLVSFPHPIVATTVVQTTALLVFLGLTCVSTDVRSRSLRMDRQSLWLFGVAGVCVALAWLTQFFALSLGSIVIVIPLVSTYPLVVMALSYAAARSVPRSPRVVLGVCCIVAGASLLQL